MSKKNERGPTHQLLAKGGTRQYGCGKEDVRRCTRKFLAVTIHIVLETPNWSRDSPSRRPPEPATVARHFGIG